MSLAYSAVAVTFVVTACSAGPVLPEQGERCGPSAAARRRSSGSLPAPQQPGHAFRTQGITSRSALPAAAPTRGLVCGAAQGSPVKHELKPRCNHKEELQGPQTNASSSLAQQPLLRQGTASNFQKIQTAASADLPGAATALPRKVTATLTVPWAQTCVGNGQAVTEPLPCVTQDHLGAACGAADQLLTSPTAVTMQPLAALPYWPLLNLSKDSPSVLHPFRYLYLILKKLWKNESNTSEINHINSSWITLFLTIIKNKLVINKNS